MPALLTSPEKTDERLYQKTADAIARLIERGTLRPGQRIPSVRRLSSQYRVSISTVLQAYQKLESRGLIEARPQSGYYVRLRLHPAPPEPVMSTPRCLPKAVSISEQVMRVVQAARDPRIVPLGAAVSGSDFLPMRQLNRILGQVGRRYLKLSHAYDFPPGNELLRVQVARRTMEAGCVLGPGDIVTTCGAQEAINLCLRAVTKPGDTVAIESPTFYGILQSIESLHLRALEIPTHPRTGICLDSLKASLRSNPVKVCLFSPNFNNPLGSCMPDDSKQQLVKMLAEREIPLIEDDIYGELVFGAVRPKAAKAYDKRGLVMLCSSFSKTLAPGYRVGWTAPGRFQEAVERLKFVNTIATATLPQLAVAEFLANGGYDRHVRRIRRIYSEQIESMTGAISRYFPQGTRVTRPAGGFVLWVELPDGIDAMELHDAALCEKISIAPGPIFSASGKFKNCFRINCGLPWSVEIEKAVMTLGRLAAKQLQ
jgi:DNA-binding transcriptional MocR family regulator